MNKLQWQRKNFKQLNTQQLYEILKLRVNVFVVEQDCPYPELDDKDTHPETIHLAAYDQGTLIAYARLLAPGTSYPESSIGRILVIKDHRRKGIGSLLVNKSTDEITKSWPKQDIKISAQEYLQGFYEDLGFKKVSKPYLEDNIPHIAMIKSSHET